MTVQEELAAAFADEDSERFELLACAFHVPFIDLEDMRYPGRFAEASRRALTFSEVHAAKKMSEGCGDQDGARLMGQMPQESPRHRDLSPVVRDLLDEGLKVRVLAAANTCGRVGHRQLRFAPRQKPYSPKAVHGGSKLSPSSTNQAAKLLDSVAGHLPCFQAAALSHKLVGRKPRPEVPELHEATLVGPPRG
jgi:hypothetical protein